VKELRGLNFSQPSNVDHFSKGCFKKNSLFTYKCFCHIELGLPFLIVNVSVFQLGDINFSTLSGEKSKILTAFISFGHKNLKPTFSIHHILNSHDLRSPLIFLFLHFIHHFLELLLIGSLFLSSVCHQALVIRDQLLKYVNLSLEVSNLFFVIRRVLLASLHNLFDALSFHLHTIEVFVGSKQLSLHFIKFLLTFTVS